LSNNDDEEIKAKEYFQKIQGDRKGDKKPERVSSITPDEFLRRERAEKDRLKQEEEDMVKTLGIMKKSLFLIVMGILSLALTFMGIFWLWPLLCTTTSSSLAHILFVIPFFLTGIVGIAVIIAGMIKLLGSKKTVVESRDW
jgi:hypothetical protein